MFTYSESSSILKNPRTNRAFGYAFIDPSIVELSGKKILALTVSVQLARKLEPVCSTVAG
jgi:hypothetical protein